MSLNKAIEHGKEHRKEYNGAKAVDKTCRNHGDCAWCRDGRLHQRHKVEEAADKDMKEFENNDSD